MMDSVDSRPQAFNSQRREQRHPGDGSTTVFHPAASTNFLLPDSHGQFTFSAEPASMLDYSSMNGTIGQESAFTPNTASSFDSSLHPDAINQSYPPTNTYMPTQNYSLSPATHSRSGQSISPSHSVDHLSPEAGYISDPSYQDLHSYATSGLNGQYLNDSFSQMTFTDNVSPQAFPQFQGEVDISILTSNTLATYNAQPHVLPSNAQPDSQSHLLSPCPTNNSSPIVTEETTRNVDVMNSQYGGNEFNPSSTPPSRTMPQHQSTPRKQQQHSPALTNSPGNMALANPQPRAHHLTSPIVRVENYGGKDSPSPSDASRPVSKRSYGSRRSGNHLSPFPNNDSSDDGDDDLRQPVRVQPVVRSTERNEDGSWMASPASGQLGLTPEDRRAMGDAWVPTIDEIAEHRLKEEKNLNVQDWLSKSEVGSESGDAPPSTNLLKPFTNRRRAKSTNDVHSRQVIRQDFGLGVRTNFGHIDDSGIPGPGVYIDERSEYDEYEDDEDDDEAIPDSPPAEANIIASRTDNEVSYPPPLEHGGLLGAIIRPWADMPTSPNPSSTRYQPPTSNAAMRRFIVRAKDVESASLAATVGSRRLSESDLGSIRAAPGVIKAIERDSKKPKDRQRRPSFLANLLPTRTPSNPLKRKPSIPVPTPPQENEAERPKEPAAEKPKKMERISSWGRPKSPRLDTSVANAREIGPPSSTGLSATSGTWYREAKNAIRRSRSRSDIGKSPGLAELMTQHGGPPMPMLASPLAETEATKVSAQPSPAGDDDDDDIQDAITMNLEVRSDPIIPTYEGFKTHTRQLNPRLSDYMVERITQEQTRRYKRLLEFRVKHLNVVKNHNCSSEKFCTALGGEPKQLTPKAGNKEGEAPFLGFQITAPDSDEDNEPIAEGTLAAAGFPSGVPLPPVKRLPAEFECPLCFKVKKFYKPSDWTKHVHEDVQPFTCTFPNCGEPKSFKRKADWVRHENERHRQLEYWTCKIADCTHTCFRKDNFVQHLVREHKIAEPRQRSAKGANKDALTNADTDDILALVAQCRRDTTKQPRDEPCRFCGNICTSWKKLTVHLAKHMEQISMPILPLVDQKQINADTIISPVVEMPESRKLSVTPNRSPVENPSRYNPKSTLAPGIDPSYGQYPSDSPGSASNVMHTYPPPQMVPYRNQQQQQQQPAQNGNYANYTMENNANYVGRTYPGLQEPAKARVGYMNGLQIPNQPYLNGGMPNGANRFPMTPVSAIGPQPGVFDTSPVDTTPFSTDTMGSTYFTQEPQSMGGTGMGDMGFDGTNAMQFQQAAGYQDMTYMTTPQQNYHYQG